MAEVLTVRCGNVVQRVAVQPETAKMLKAAFAAYAAELGRLRSRMAAMHTYVCTCEAGECFCFCDDCYGD